MRFRSPASTRRWASYLTTTVLIAVLSGTATYWALQLFAPRVAIAPAGSLVDWQKAPDLGAASRLFGAPPSAGGGPADAVMSNIRVLGVAASTLRATAILSIDGKPPIALMAGARINDHARLLEVHPDAVVIEQAGGQIRLPAPKRPDIGVLSAGAAQPGTPSLASPVGMTPATPSAASPPPASMPTPAEQPVPGPPDQPGEPQQAAEYAPPESSAEPADNPAVDRGPPEGASGIRGGAAQ